MRGILNPRVRLLDTPVPESACLQWVARMLQNARAFIFIQCVREIEKIVRFSFAHNSLDFGSWLNSGPGTPPHRTLHELCYKRQSAIQSAQRAGRIWKAGSVSDL